MDDYGHWDIDKIGKFNPLDWFGFIYLITNKINGRRYIGKKNFTFKKRYQLHKRSRIKYVQSDWKSYNSSCTELQNDIAKLGEENFTFEIVKLCSGKSELTLTEEELQHKHDVIRSHLPDGQYAFYNKAIGSRHYAGAEKQSTLSEAKMKLLRPIDKV